MRSVAVGRHGCQLQVAAQRDAGAVGADCDLGQGLLRWRDNTSTRLRSSAAAHECGKENKGSQRNSDLSGWVQHYRLLLGEEKAGNTSVHYTHGFDLCNCQCGLVRVTSSTAYLI